MVPGCTFELRRKPAVAYRRGDRDNGVQRDRTRRVVFLSSVARTGTQVRFGPQIPWTAARGQSRRFVVVVNIYMPMTMTSSHTT